MNVNATFPTIAVRVPSEMRQDFLRNIFGEQMLDDGVSEIREALFKICHEKKDSYLEYFTLTNGGFFVAPANIKKTVINYPKNQTRSEASASVLGIAASLIALSVMLEKELSFNEMDTLSHYYHDLKNFAERHAESGPIFSIYNTFHT